MKLFEILVSVTIITSVLIMEIILSNLERNTNFRTLFGIVVITIAIMLLIGSSSIPNMALSKSSSLNNNKPPSHIPLLSNGGIAGNSSSSASNLNGFHNQSSSTSLYSAPPPSASTLAGNISKGVSSSNKVGNDRV